MKRDMDLVRRILKETSESSESLDAQVFINDECDLQTICYHMDIMSQYGLIEASTHKAFGGKYIFGQVDQLTWAGNDFLASVTSDMVWSQVKLDIAKKAADAPFSVIAALATKICASQLGL